MEKPEDILTLHYKELPISNSLKRFFGYHALPNLKALLCYKSKELLEMKWFNVRLYRELIVVLEDHGVLDRLR
jgi:hypothetical protein